MSNIIETRIPQYRFASMEPEQEAELRDTCKKFARDMRFDFQFNYYSIYWEPENWTLANLAMPEIDQLLKAQ